MPNSDLKPFWMQLPVATSFLVTSHFNDPRDYPNAPHKKQKHEGIDLNAVDAQARPVAVLAAQRGVVEKVGNFPPGYGKYVRIRHQWPDGHTYVTWYGHLSEIQVQEGKFVPAGHQIGIAGDTGNAFGVHLHLTLQHLGHGLDGYVVDDVVDPLPFFNFNPPATLDELFYLADVTVPDGTILQPGQTFPKTWRVRNSGTRTWDQNFDLALFSGESLGAPEKVPLPKLDPGDEGTVTVPMKSPDRPGRYRSAWKARNPEGDFFEFEIFTEIQVASGGQDNARFLADVTIPDDSAVPAGQTFLKKWQVRNTGTTAWGRNYRLAWFEDDLMDAPSHVAVPFTRSGEEAIVSVTLKAPRQPGRHRSTWRLENDQGQPFGDLLFTVIEVPRQIEPDEPVDEMRYVNDVTIADGTLMQPGQTFEKVWRVRNSGTTSWGEGFRMAFFSDEQMGGPAEFPLPEVRPGRTVDLAVTLTAPEMPGTHRSTWKPRNPQGDFFEFEMFTEIEVVRRASPTDLVDDALFVKDLTIPDGTVIQAGVTFTKTWRMRNVGTSSWGAGYELAFVKDEPMSEEAHIPLPAAEPGEEVDISLRLTAPLLPGRYKSTWRPRSPDGEVFGHFFFALITVPNPLPSAGKENKAALVSHESFRPGTTVKTGTSFRKLWRVKNTGTTAWGAGYTLAHVQGERFGGPRSIEVPATEPLRSARLALPLTAPETSGRQRGVWKLRDPQGNLFGPPLVVSVVVR